MDAETQRQFKHWWEHEGHCLESSAKQLAKLAWSNGAYCESRRMVKKIEELMEEFGE